MIVIDTNWRLVLRFKKLCQPISNMIYNLLWRGASGCFFKLNISTRKLLHVMPSIRMVNVNLHETNSPTMLSQTFSTDMKRNNYIESTAKYATSDGASQWRTRQFFFSCENMFCSFIDLLFFRRSDIADNSGRTLLLCMYSFFTKSKNRIGYVICTVLASQLPSIYHPSNVAYFFLCCITSWSKWLLFEIRTLEEWIFFDKFQYVTGNKCIYIYI